MRIILASRSKARKSLLEQLGVKFECHTSNYEEDMNAFRDPAKLAKFLALEKAKFIAKKFPGSLIIGADTFTTIGNKKIGKPANISEAKKIIREMSGNKVGVHTGVAVVETDTKGRIIKKNSEHVLTTILFSEISDKAIDKIIKTDDVLSLSGAFSIEGEGGKYVKDIEGDYHNVIGLPLFQLDKMLKKTAG